MAKILRGEIRWADLNPTIGRKQSGERPVLILSQDIFNDRSGTVIAMALTSQEPKAGFPLTHEILASKLPKQSWVKISQIRTLSTERIGKKIGSVGANELAHGFAILCASAAPLLNQYSLAFWQQRQATTPELNQKIVKLRKILLVSFPAPRTAGFTC